MVEHTAAVLIEGLKEKFRLILIEMHSAFQADIVQFVNRDLF